MAKHDSQVLFDALLADVRTYCAIRMAQDVPLDEIRHQIMKVLVNVLSCFARDNFGTSPESLGEIVCSVHIARIAHDTKAGLH